jgi:hypothetical protein
VVEAVDLIEVDAIRLQTAQSIVDGVHDVLARESSQVGVVHRIEHLGGDDRAVAARLENRVGVIEPLSI